MSAFVFLSSWGLGGVSDCAFDGQLQFNNGVF